MKDLCSPPLPPIRPIHYLGSKVSMLDAISETVAELCPPSGTVCDLFSGSATVAAHLGQRWAMLAADIQEYARTLAAALLLGPGALRPEQLRLTPAALPRDVQRAIDALIAAEDEALRQASAGAPEQLCALMEAGAVERFSSGDAAPDAALRPLLQALASALQQAPAETMPRALVTRYFGGLYFSWSQAAQLDALLAAAHALPSPSREFYLAAVLATASDVVNTVGKQFAQPIKPRDGKGRIKRHLVSQTVRDRSLQIEPIFSSWCARLLSGVSPRGGHTALRGDYRQILEDRSLRFDVVYADPPYTRDHYSRFYHVLETMARYDEPDISTTRIRTGGVSRMGRPMYRDDRHQSPFSIKSQAHAAFRGLFAGIAARGIPLVLSYSPWNEEKKNRPRMVSQAQLLSIARESFSRVELRSLAGTRHSKFNRRERNVDVDINAEILVVCAEPRR